MTGSLRHHSVVTACLLFACGTVTGACGSDTESEGEARAEITETVALLTRGDTSAEESCEALTDRLVEELYADEEDAMRACVEDPENQAGELAEGFDERTAGFQDFDVVDLEQDSATAVGTNGAYGGAGVGALVVQLEFSLVREDDVWKVDAIDQLDPTSPGTETDSLGTGPTETDSLGTGPTETD